MGTAETKPAPCASFVKKSTLFLLGLGELLTLANLTLKLH